MKLFFVCLLSVLGISLSQAAEIATIAGTGEKGFSGDGGPAVEAKLDNPFGVTVGPDGDIYFCDTLNHVVRKISRQSGKISTIAGTGEKGHSGDGGPATEAQCFEPYEVRFHPSGDLYWVEMQNNLVRRLDARTGNVSTVAGTGEKGFGGDGGPATKGTMDRPHSIQFDQSGENLYICDIGNHRIRRVDLAKGVIDTWCGNGKAEPTKDGAKVSPETPLKGPRALDIAPNGDLWLALREGNQVYRIDMKAGTLHHMAGTGGKGFDGNGGPAKEATLSGPKGVAISPDGKLVYLADTESHSVRAIDLRNDPPTLEIIAGDGQKGDGPDSPDPLKCRMARLHGVGIDPVTGDLYIGDSETHKVRRITGLEGAKPVAAFKDFEVEEFEIAGRRCQLAKPKKAAPGNPWIWRCRFFGSFPQADAALLARGWHVAAIDVANLFGGPEAMKAFDAFYEEMTAKRKFATKPVIEGFSRGGLPALNWPIANPEKVAGIYLDAPVIDIHTWPKEYSPKLWPICLAAYGLTVDNADTWKGPVEHLAPLAKAKMPILAICGGVDSAVPFPRNTALLEKRYRELGGPITVVVKATCDHHPHSLYDPTPVVEWVEKVAGKSNQSAAADLSDEIQKALAAISKRAVKNSSHQERLVECAVEFYRGLEFQPAWTGSRSALGKDLKRLRETITTVLDAHAVRSDNLPAFEAKLDDPKSAISPADLAATLTLLDGTLRLRRGPPELPVLWEDYREEREGPRKWAHAFAPQFAKTDPAKVETLLAGASPRNAIYQSLFDFYHSEKSKLETSVADFKLLELPEGAKSVKVGHTWPETKALAERLESQGYLETAEVKKIADIFTQPLSDALKQFQEANHLNADGVLGARTVASLNLGPGEKLARLELNLQRARQLPDDLGSRVVMVNLPAGEMNGFENGELKANMRVVFGQAIEGRRTPLFHDVMEYVVFRPYWRVPMGIVKKEIAPNTEKDPQGWYKKGYEIVRDFSDKTPLRPSWDNLNAAAQGKLLVRQTPGNGNALGLVKFLFPNDHSVYMHDTPVKHLFARGDRDHSHGCIRLQHPDKMAEFVLGPEGWDAEKVKSAMNGNSRKSVTIDKPINVYIVYFTAWPAADKPGQIAWLPDVYGRDQSEGELIAKARISEDSALTSAE